MSPAVSMSYWSVFERDLVGLDDFAGSNSNRWPTGPVFNELLVSFREESSGMADLQARIRTDGQLEIGYKNKNPSGGRMAELGFGARSFAGVTEGCCLGRAWRGRGGGGSGGEREQPVFRGAYRGRHSRKDPFGHHQTELLRA